MLFELKSVQKSLDCCLIILFTIRILFLHAYHCLSVIFLSKFSPYWCLSGRALRPSCKLRALPFVAQLFIDLAHCDIDRCLFWAQVFKLLKHFETLWISVHGHQNCHFLVLGQGAFWVELLGLFKALQGVHGLVAV